MTIKPVVAPSQKRAGAGTSSEGDKKDVHPSNVGDTSSGNHATGSRTSGVHGHRNVSPQRRVDVYEELNRHRRSPHKSTRTKRRDQHLVDHHHKRVSAHTEKHAGVPAVKCNSPSSSSSSVSGIASTNNVVAHAAAVGSKPPDNVLIGSQSPKSQAAPSDQSTAGLRKAIEDALSGYNSGDEYVQPKEGQVTVDEWQRKDEQFAKCMADRGYILKPVEEDGACLFRSISLQIYGDEEMHDVIRQHTMDYIFKNREYFSQFVTEDINSYIQRKRRKDAHGNHIEIQAMSEIYSRPVEVYCYKPTPINIFNSEQLDNGYAPLRLSYQRGSHYNAIIDPYNATVGVGLGLAGYKPELQTKEAVRMSEQQEIEQTMFEDKLKTTDWEATNEAIEEQIARESYLQWCRDNLQQSRNTTASSASTSATVTSGQVFSDSEASPSKYAAQRAAANFNSSTVTSSSSCSTSSSTLTTSVAASTSTNVEHTFSSVSPKHLSSQGYVKKFDDIGCESDETDMSSSSSMCGGTGNTSPSRTSRNKQTKSRSVSATTSLRTGKKRRRDITNKQSDEDVSSESQHKSPKCDVRSSSDKRSLTPDYEHQEPCTSKQSNSPDKQNVADSLAMPSSSATASVMSNTSNDVSPGNKQTSASLYQELLEASYANEGFDQLSESEMLQRAIQMSTHDYIEDQKRKYFY